MAKTREEIGCFVEALCCTKCDWFNQPFLKIGSRILPPIPVSICPDCGSPIASMVGQYKIKETKIFWWSTNEYIGFIRKGNAGEKNNG